MNAAPPPVPAPARKRKAPTQSSSRSGYRVVKTNTAFRGLLDFIPFLSIFCQEPTGLQRGVEPSYAD